MKRFFIIFGAAVILVFFIICSTLFTAALGFKNATAQYLLGWCCENISGTFLYSIESYAQRNQSTTNTDLLNLINAMMKYGDSARAYAG